MSRLVIASGTSSGEIHYLVLQSLDSERVEFILLFSAKSWNYSFNFKFLSIDFWLIVFIGLEVDKFRFNLKEVD